MYPHMNSEANSMPPHMQRPSSMPQMHHPHMMWQNQQSMSPGGSGTSSQSSGMSFKTEQSSNHSFQTEQSNASSFSHNMNTPIPTPVSSGPLSSDRGSTSKNSKPKSLSSAKSENSQDSVKMESEDSKHSTDSMFKKPKDENSKAEVKKEDLEDIPDSVFKDVWPREFDVYLVNDAYKTNAARAKTVGKYCTNSYYIFEFF